MSDAPTAPRPAPGADTAPASPPEPEGMVRLLTPDGRRVAHPVYDVACDEEELLGLYRDLVLVRRLDAEAEALQRQGELGLWAGLLGQEAAQVGSARALRRQDHAFPTYREHGVAWCRGVDPLHIMELYRGTSHGGWDPAAHGLHPYTLVIAAQMLPAAGYAMGVQRDGAVGSGDPERDTAVIAYLGDGATSQGEAAEALQWAAVFNAPLVVLCQNNQWAISEPVSVQSRVPLHRRAEGAGVPGVLVDGNDVLACLAVTRAALDRARSGGGPTFVEAHTYRMGAHTTSDDPTRYRSAAEVDLWRAKDPVDRFRRYLQAEGILDDDFAAALAAEAEQLAERLRSGVRTLPDPGPLEMFDHAYAEPHAQVVEERDSFAAYLASFDDVPHHAPATTAAGGMI